MNRLAHPRPRSLEAGVGGLMIAALVFASACASTQPGSLKPEAGSSILPSETTTVKDPTTTLLCQRPTNEQAETLPEISLHAFSSIEVEARALSGVLALFVDDDSRMYVVVEPSFREPYPDWASSRNLIVVKSCLNDGLLAAVQSIVASVTPLDGFSSVSYDAVTDRVTVMTTQEVSVVEAAIRSGYNQPIAPSDLALVHLSSGGPAIGTTS